MSTIDGLKAVVRRVPGVRWYQRRVYEDRFANELYGAFRGVFSSFAEAAASSPRRDGLSFRDARFADEYTDRLERIYDYDYPVLFWLKDLLVPGVRVFDLGGNVGVHFFAYQKYLKFPERLTWNVCEVPEVVERGRALAAERKRPELTFTSQLEALDGHSVLIAAGALHYIERPSLAELLKGAAKKPATLLLNKLPLHEGEGFVTLQNVGPSFAPMHVYNRAQFIQSIEAQGYQLVDQWNDRIHSCHIPFETGRSVPMYSGLHFSLRSP